MSGERELEKAPGIRPGPSVSRHLDMAARRALPTVATALLVIVLDLPLHLPGLAELQQVAAVASVYFWSVYRPLSMPPLAAFAIGLLLDLLGPEPPGIAMVVLLATNGAALRLRVRLARQGFLMVWATFTGVASLAFAAQWVLTSALDWRMLPPAPLLLEAGLAAGLYPLIATLLIRAHASAAAPERA